MSESTRKILTYVRVSSRGQAKGNKEGLSDLTRQRDRLRKYAKDKYVDDEIVEFIETGSAMNFCRKKLGQMLESILAGKYDGSVLLVEFRDRLCRFGIELVELICKAHSVEVVYVEQQNQTDEEMLTADLLSIIFIFGIKQYSSRAGKRLRKEPAPECMMRGKELLQAGLTLRAALAQLKKEGHECTDWMFRAYIARPMAKLQKTVPVGMNSAREYFSEFAQSGPENVRVGISDLVNHYERWCRTHKKLAVSKRRLCAEFNSSYRPTHHAEAGRCYVGLMIRGAKLHVTVNHYVQKAKPESELDHLLKFHSSIKGKTLTQEQIMGSYYRFARKNEVGKVATRETVLSTIRALGATPIKRSRVLALVC